MDEDEKELYRMRGRLCALRLITWMFRTASGVLGLVLRVLSTSHEERLPEDWHVHDMLGLETYVGPRDGCPYFPCDWGWEKDD